MKTAVVIVVLLLLLLLSLLLPRREILHKIFVRRRARNLTMLLRVETAMLSLSVTLSCEIDKINYEIEVINFASVVRDVSGEL